MSHDYADIDIDIRVPRLDQPFDSLDPSPFREKPLDTGFEAYLREALPSTYRPPA